MKKEQNRKLAAIMFCDIQGYTTLMQSDEASARLALQKFRNELTEKVAAFKGQIINFYGDGCLCIFDSSVDATSCAAAVQKIFQATTPKVPVRIGLHSGDVFFEADNVYGDSVNLTSRIESMGISGSVLISERVYRDIKNQTIFQPVDLGAFEFKNVAQPMKVYALQGAGLALPEAGQLKGKLKPTPVKSKTKAFLWLVPVLLILGILGFWYSSQDHSTIPIENLSTTGTPLPRTIKEQRVAVLPMQNNTNDPDLDILGKMASDWITRGLMEIEDAEVVSPFTVNQHLDAIGILPGNPSGKTSFSELTGAQNFINGNFYKEGDELIFHLEMVDAIGGKMQFSFPEISGNTSDKKALVTQLVEKISGYWATKDLVNLKKIKPPHYKAYQLYEAFIKTYHDEESLTKILEIDSNFNLARIQFLLYNKAGGFGNSKTHFDFMDRHLDQLSNYEKAWFSYLKSVYLGDPLTAFESINSIRIKYPKDFSVNHEAAATAAELLNNPQLALDIYSELDASIYRNKKIGVLYNWRAYHEMNSALELKDTLLLEQLYQNLKPDQSSLQAPLFIAKLFAAAALNREADFDKYLNDFFYSDKNVDSFLSSFMFGAASSTFFNEKQFQKITRVTLAFVNQSEQREEIRTYYKNILEVWEGKIPVVDFETLAELNQAEQIINLYWAGIALVKAGKMHQLAPILERLKSLTRIELHDAAHLSAGSSYYTMGVIYTQMGAIDQALYNLKKARDLGTANWLHNFNYDRNLAPLFDLPEFQAINQAKWPKIRD